MSLSKDSSVESAIKTILKNRCMSARLASVYCKFVYDYDAIANAISREKIASRDESLALPQAAAERWRTSGSDVLGYNGTDLISPVKPNTIASSIAIGNPADSFYVVHAIKESGGWGESVTDKEVMKGSSFSQVLKEFLPSRQEEPKFR